MANKYIYLFFKILGIWFLVFLSFGIAFLVLISGSLGAVELVGFILVGVPILGLIPGLLHFLIVCGVRYYRYNQSLQSTAQKERLN